MDLMLQKKSGTMWALPLAADQQLYNPSCTFTACSSSIRTSLGSKSLSFPHHTFWCIHLLAKFFTYARVWRKRAEMMYRNVSNQFLFSFAIILRAIKKALMLKYIFPLRIVLDEQPVSDPLLSQCKSWVCFWTKHCDFLIHKIIQKKCTCPWIGQWYLSFLVLAPVNGWILCH